MLGDLQESAVSVSTSRSFIQQLSVLTFPVPGLGVDAGPLGRVRSSHGPWNSQACMVWWGQCCDRGDCSGAGQAGPGGSSQVCWVAQEFLREGSTLKPRPGQRSQLRKGWYPRPRDPCQRSPQSIWGAPGEITWIEYHPHREQQSVGRGCQGLDHRHPAHGAPGTLNVTRALGLHKGRSIIGSDRLLSIHL